MFLGTLNPSNYMWKFLGMWCMRLGPLPGEIAMVLGRTKFPFVVESRGNGVVILSKLFTKDCGGF